MLNKFPLSGLPSPEHHFRHTACILAPMDNLSGSVERITL
jgi:hypothetical protein